MICNASSFLHIINKEGEIVQVVHMPKQIKTDFTGMALSPRKTLVYALGEDKTAYVFKLARGLSPVLEAKVALCEKYNVLGISVADEKNTGSLACFDDGGILKLFKSIQ